MTEPDVSDVVLPCRCGGREQLGPGFYFRIHDHACPEMPADMANIPNEIRENNDDD